jgi:hypothetical protein
VTSEERFAKIVGALKRNPNVSLGAAKKGFGSSALCVGDKIFAMISAQGGFVVKLPKARVDALVALGVGSRFEPARGRVMKEWLAVDATSSEDWLSLAREAQTFVGGSLS